MPRRSSIKQLPSEVRAKIDGLLRDGRFTLDQIMEKLDELEVDISRSALGRYRKSFEEQAREMREARQMADVWVDKLGKQPEGKMGRLVIELLRTLAFKVTMSAGEVGAHGVKAKAGDVFFLSKAIKELESAAKISADREMKIREAERAEAVKTVEREGKKAGLTDETIASIKQGILGVKA